MWKPGSMGWHHGWHFGQAHEMLERMHEHSRDWRDHDWYKAPDDNPFASFLNSFAEKMGENAADAVVGPSSDNG